MALSPSERARRKSQRAVRWRNRYEEEGNPDESLAYRREIKVIFFGSLYAINKYLDAGIFIAHINKTREI